jgi:AraC-like DNA-binding protein
LSDDRRSPQRRDRPFTQRVTPLMHTLVEAAFPANIGSGKAELVAWLMLDELTETVHAQTVLLLPISSIERRVADLAFKDRQNRLNIDDLASRAATSVRTVSRLFPLETRLTLKAWRKLVRIVQVMNRLAREDAVPAFLPSSVLPTPLRSRARFVRSQPSHRQLAPETQKPPSSNGSGETFMFDLVAGA